jgi:hypothetical protein
MRLSKTGGRRRDGPGGIMGGLFSMAGRSRREKDKLLNGQAISR